MKISKLNLITILILSLSTFKVSADTNIEKENSNVTVEKSEVYINPNFLNQFILLNEEEKKEFLKDLIQKKGTTVKLNNEKTEYKVPLTAFLLIQNFENEALFLIEEKLVEPFKFFTINNKKQSDLGIAIKKNNFNYFEGVLKNIDNVNKQYDINDKKGITLLMETALINEEYIYPFVSSLLENGANENLQSLNGITAYDIAKNNGNEAFLNALSDYSSQESIKSEKGYLVNNKLPPESKVEQQLMIENLNNGLLKDLKEKDELYKALHSMIIFGFNDAADIILNEIKKEGDFNPNKTNDNGVSLVMAAAMSELTNGNVEYLIKLIEEGADYKNPINGITPIQVAVKRDNVKVVVALIEKGVSIFANENNKVDLFTFALNVKPMPSKTVKFLLSFVKSLKEKAEKLNSNKE